ncbi:hypothetical protein CONLIGDRAFT_675586 [Coniochaeta ligniaria NRRL 30616]|uniref:Zn(2)-C6 fungal-type domain-containing protein n=1 Tax=Coniochaeta ligniaria NRRL 30616 TaxID=1408157 RepID=A0A1J7JMJ4_9PEZI|nr:hypothetical protein CONLIGDRAFT_675586 [Coniochaeta ligniaria NRRL 30616]
MASSPIFLINTFSHSSRDNAEQYGHIRASSFGMEDRVLPMPILNHNAMGGRRTSNPEEPESRHQPHSSVLYRSPTLELPAGYGDAPNASTGHGLQTENQSNMGKKKPPSKGPRGRYGCRTCRQRHLKCDENRPSCENCTKARRDCVWNHELRVSHDPRSSSSSQFRPRALSSVSNASFEDWSSHYRPEQHARRLDAGQYFLKPDALRQLERDSSGDYLAPISRCEWVPSDLLRSPLAASLFQFYIEYAGPWLDITSPSRHFASTVPRLAMSNPVLLFACLSYSAKCLVPSSSLSEQYSNACIKLLIPLLSDEVFVSTDETLLATLVILRHVEQYAEAPEDKGAHLSGAFSLIASQRVLPPHDSLPGAALWTYMRQDIRQALLNRSSPKLKPSHGIQIDNFDTVAEVTWADRACHLAALACTYAWGGTTGEVDGDVLTQLLDWWKENLPKEYLPYHDTEDAICYLASWHCVAWQFYHLARILLQLYHAERPRDMDVFAFNQHIESEITAHARTICRIAYSSSHVGCLYNASAMLGFIGSYFRDSGDQDRLISFMRNFSAETNWPTSADQARLLDLWQTRVKS